MNANTRSAERSKEEQQRKEEERGQQFQREHDAHEAERARLSELYKARLAMLDRIVASAPRHVHSRTTEDVSFRPHQP